MKAISWKGEKETSMDKTLISHFCRTAFERVKAKLEPRITARRVAGGI
jgi:hypothetical protein